jgi:hypothetical protein
VARWILAWHTGKGRLVVSSEHQLGPSSPETLLKPYRSRSPSWTSSGIPSLRLAWFKSQVFGSEKDHISPARIALVNSCGNEHPAQIPHEVAGNPLWGAKIRCPPEKSASSRQDAILAPHTHLRARPRSIRDGNEVAAPTNGSPLSSGKNPAGRRGNKWRFLESRLRSPAQCTSLRHRE